MNGKLSSQDLSIWVTGHGGPDDDAKRDEDWEKLIPPLKELSSFFLGDRGQSSISTAMIHQLS